MGRRLITESNLLQKDYFSSALERYDTLTRHLACGHPSIIPYWHLQETKCLITMLKSFECGNENTSSEIKPSADVDNIRHILILGSIQQNRIATFTMADHRNHLPATESPVLDHGPQILRLSPVIPVSEFPLTLTVACEIEPVAANPRGSQSSRDRHERGKLLGRLKSVTKNAQIFA